MTGRCANARKLDNNTYAERRENAIAIRLHQTDVVTFFADRAIVANSGGWKTHTTKARMNDYLPIRIYQERGQWYWGNNGNKTPFTDGDKIGADGKLQAQKTDCNTELALRKRILKYAKLYAALPLERPGNGDCLFCNAGMRTAEGKTLGDATGDKTHLESHIEEGYVVPSLAYNAMKEAGAGQALYWGVFPEDGKASFITESAKKQLPRWVAKYMYHRFGLPA